MSVAQVTSSLKQLNFDIIDYKTKKYWEVTIPNLRSDDIIIIREMDLIEEIGRLYEFNNFLTQLPKLKKIGKKDLSYKTRPKLTNGLINLGLNELINPLVKDYANLRSSLLSNILKAIQKNKSQSNLEFEGFEYGHVFFKNDSNEIQ